jgi:oligo-1,6-glucosidase
MKGTPFIYQGEEIGMTNYPFDDVSDFKDISSISSYQYHLDLAPDDPVSALRKAAMRSRDNARTPMQWTSGFYAGFSSVKPWIKVNPNYQKSQCRTQSQRSSLLVLSLSETHSVEKRFNI